jgi:hypothetical protein
MLEVLLTIGGAAVGILWSAWRLRDPDAGVMHALRRVVPFAGGGPPKIRPR